MPESELERAKSEWEDWRDSLAVEVPIHVVGKYVAALEAENGRLRAALDEVTEAAERWADSNDESEMGDAERATGDYLLGLIELAVQPARTGADSDRVARRPEPSDENSGVLHVSAAVRALGGQHES